MPEKDPTSYSLLTYGWVVVLSISGGIVSFMRKVNEGQARRINLAELFGEIFTSGFTGLLTFWLCEAGEVDPLISAVMIGVSGHMGSRALMQLEGWLARKFPGRDDDFPPTGGVA